MYVSFLIFQLLGMYLHEVIPQEFGTSQPLNFPFRTLMKKIKGDHENIGFHESSIYKSDDISEQVNDEEAKKEK